MTESLEIYKAIISAQKPSIPVNVDLWDSETIAAYLKCSVSQVMQRYAPRPDFPRTIRLPSDRRGSPRWKATEVIEWAESFREKTAA